MANKRSLFLVRNPSRTKGSNHSYSLTALSALWLFLVSDSPFHDFALANILFPGPFKRMDLWVEIARGALDV